MILSVYQGYCFGARTVYRKVCIGDMSPRKYMPKYIKPRIKRNNTTCVCETYIISMLIQPDL